MVAETCRQVDEDAEDNFLNIMERVRAGGAPAPLGDAAGEPAGEAAGEAAGEERPRVRKRPAAAPPARGRRGERPAKRPRRALASPERIWCFGVFDTISPHGAKIHARELAEIKTLGQNSEPPTLSASVTEHHIRSAQRTWRGLKKRVQQG